MEQIIKKSIYKHLKDNSDKYEPMWICQKQIMSVWFPFVTGYKLVGMGEAVDIINLDFSKALILYHMRSLRAAREIWF